jgi:hypothetical protein
MALLGPFIDTGATDGGGLTTKISVTNTPADIDLGEIPAGHYIDRLTVIITTPGAIGTKLNIQDATGADILPAPLYVKLETARRMDLYPGLVTELDKQLTAKISGVTGANTVEGYIIKHLVNITGVI